MEFARIVRTGFKSSPRPNSICHLLLQVLSAGPNRLPKFSKPELTELATSVKADEREGFRKLRQFVAGDLRDEANETQVTRSLEGLEKPGNGLHPLILSAYVLFVFATTKQAGAGFTQDPRRLCVSMSRHKNFLALIGDIDTVDYENFVPAGKDEVRVYLVNIHKYFVDNKRVATYEKIHEDVQDAAEVPVPFTAVVRDVDDQEEDQLVAQIDGMQAQMLRLQEQINAVTAALNAQRALKSSKTVTESTTEFSSTSEADISKPMTFRQKMMARTRDVSKTLQRAAADAGTSGDQSLKPGNSGTSGVQSWTSSDDTGNSSGGGSYWGADTSGKSGDQSWNTSCETGNSNTSFPTSESGLRGGP